jgi:iron complex transport system ATP-binding protein
MMEILFKAEHVSGGYHEETIVHDVSFEIARGDFLGIIGPNGSGKSTLLRLLTRVLPLERGDVELNGEKISRMSVRELAKKVAFVPQDTFIHFPFRVEEIVLMGRIPHLKRLQFETQKDFLIAENAMTLTDVLPLRRKEIDELSAGERQRVIIAKALTQEPVLLFLDEPTSHLDIGHQVRVLDLLKRLNREKQLTVVIVLHDLNLASEYCDRILLLNEGRVFKEGRPEEVLTYANIEAVYKTVVVVNKNPISSKPYVLLVPGQP